MTSTAVSDETGRETLADDQLDLIEATIKAGKDDCLLSSEIIGNILAGLGVARAALSAAPARTWECSARKQSLPEPADCGWPTCGCDPHADKVIAALEEQGQAAPVAQEPVAYRFKYATDMWIYSVNAPDPNDGHRYFDIQPLYTSPPAALAGLGADEIARASNWKLVDGTMTTGESVIFDGSFIIAKVTRREDAELILALLSRGSGER